MFLNEDQKILFREKQLTELRKALNVTDGSGAPLIREDLERLIRQTLLSLSPLSQMIPNVTAIADVHVFTRRIALSRGGHEGEAPTPTYQRSTYDRRQVAIKILRNYGQVTDFQQSASRSYADSVAEETMSSIEGMVDLFEFSTMWGTSDEFLFTGDAMMYPGWYQWLLRDAATTNVIDIDDVIKLDDLDAALARSRRKFKQTRNDRYVWLMSESMENKIAGLQTRIQRQVQSLEFEGGFVMSTYKGIPILISSFTEPDADHTSPSLATGATGGTSGTIADGTYAYKIASITLYGEQVAGVKSGAITLSGGGNGSTNLSWTADTDALLYAIYRADSNSTDDDDYDLLDIINAKTYTNGKATGVRSTYTDNGSLTPIATVHPLGSGEEVICLINLNEERGIARPVLNPSLGDPIDSLINYVPLVENTATYQWALQSYHALQVPWGQTHSIIRRARTAAA